MADDLFVQAEGFAAAIPASWCTRCGSLVLNGMRDAHVQSLHPDPPAAGS